MPQPSELLEQKRMVREQHDGLHVIDAIMIFRDGIRPEWEDPANSSGGHFQFQLKPAIGGGSIDEYWNNLVLGLIGCTIEPLWGEGQHSLHWRLLHLTISAPHFSTRRFIF